MAIRITRIDDIDGSDGAELIGFELDSRAYEIDLCPRNRARFLRMIRSFIENARPVESGEEPTSKIAETSLRRVNRENVREVVEFEEHVEPKSNDFDLIELARRVQD
jgi:hypothetical protein